jgi:predicted component of type VI protein secretion system
MKKLLFATAAVATLALAACSSNNEDSVQNAELNQPAAEFNDMSGEALNDAAAGEAAALGTQQQQLEQENASAPADENASEPTTDDEEQNVSGM